MNLLAHIADRVLGRPLLLHPQKAELIASVLGERIGLDIEFKGQDWEEVYSRRRADVPAANRLIGEPVGSKFVTLYRRIGGVGVIPIVGSLINRGAFVGDDGSGMVSYEGIAAQIRAAMGDPQVFCLLLDIDSPGGEATGMFALAQQIRNARSEKPVTAQINDMAASAAYGLASNATEIVVTPTSITGSIGVVLMHMDRSGEMAMKGRKPSFIYAGARKVDGNEFGPLSDDVRSDLQREVNTFYDRFVEVVASGRPMLSGADIRGTEARMFIGSEAIDKRLADRVGTFDETLSRLTSAVRARGQIGGSVMTANLDINPAMMTVADHQTALAIATVAARADGETAGRVGAVDRIRSILTCAESVGRMATALVFALDTDMTPEAAVKALAAVPLAAEAAKVPPLTERAPGPLQHNDNPNKASAEVISAGWDSVIAGVNKENSRARAA